MPRLVAPLLGSMLFMSSLSQAGASEKIFELGPPTDHPTGIRFHLPYSLGTHDGAALEVFGTVTLDLTRPHSVSGGFKVPIRSLRNGNKTRDCHMLEALGIDYTKSRYPDEHVCNSDNEIPASGPDSVAFPDIEFKIKALQISEGSIKVLDGEWIVHGVARPVNIPVQVTTVGDEFRIQGKSIISLKEHGIVVKPAKVLFVKIGVEDSATVDLDLRLRPRK